MSDKYNNMHSFISKTFSLLALILIAIGVSYVQAKSYSEPSSAPVGGNTPSFINVGPSFQVKEGGLVVNEFSALKNASLQGAAYFNDIVVGGTNAFLSFGSSVVPTDLRVSGTTYAKSDGLYSDKIINAGELCADNSGNITPCVTTPTPTDPSSVIVGTVGYSCQNINGYGYVYLDFGFATPLPSTLQLQVGGAMLTDYWVDGGVKTISYGKNLIDRSAHVAGTCKDYNKNTPGYSGGGESYCYSPADGFTVTVPAGSTTYSSGRITSGSTFFGCTTLSGGRVSTMQYLVYGVTSPANTKVYLTVKGQTNYSGIPYRFTGEQVY